MNANFPKSSSVTGLNLLSTNLLWLLFAALIVILDQVSKILITKYFVFEQVTPILPFFNIFLTYNPGAAFNFLAHTNGNWQTWFFIGIMLIVSGGIIISLWRVQADGLTKCSLMLILGGAIGNGIDRVLYGYVRDFLDLYWTYHIKWIPYNHWPAFNLADSALCIGAALLLIKVFRSSKKVAI